MANTLLTHQMIAREAAAVLAEEAPFIMGINRGREKEFGAATQGYQKGDTVKVSIPPTGRVFSGSVFAEGGGATDVKESFVNLTLDTQKHIGLQFGAKEKLLDITDFRERILRPQMQTLSSVVEADLLAKAYAGVPNLIGTAGSLPSTMKTYAQARAKLEQYLTPPGERSTLFTSDANTELVDASRQLFHAKNQIEQGFLRGTIGEAQGAMFYEHQSMPVHTNGSQIVNLLVNGVPAAGATTLTVDGGTGTNTVKKGSVFTIANVFAVHPQTGQTTGKLQQFVVTADLTLSAGGGVLSIYPAINAVAPNRTVVAAPDDNAALTFVGAASTGYRQNLMFHKDAFTAAFAPLPVLASCEGYTATLPNGVSVRVMTFGD
ncbi:MAG: P22 phage major capsid protein family protein, partial [Moraxellaceae bacterium]